MSLDFGEQPLQSEKTFPTFLLKVLLLSIPGMLIGNTVDQQVKKLQMKGKLGYRLLPYVALQIFIASILVYAIYSYSLTSNYAKEFQSSFAGLFFAAMFFNTQSNLITNIQKMLGNI